MEPDWDGCMKFVKLTLITIAGILVAGAIFSYVFWAVFFFPDDFEVTREEALMAGPDAPGQRIDLSLLEALDGALLSGDFSGARIDGIIARIRKKNLLVKHEAYSRSKRAFLNVRMGTGHAGVWVDERSSLILPSHSKISFPVHLKKNSLLAFSALAPLSGGTLKVNVCAPGVKSRERIFRLEPHIQKFTSSDAAIRWNNRGFPRARDNAGWRNIEIPFTDLPSARGTVSFSFSGDEGGDSAAVIAHPAVFAPTEERRYNVIYVIFDGVSTRLWSFYNDKSGLTPFMREAAEKDFIVFDNMFALGDKTRISTVGLFCSIMPFLSRHGINRNFIPENEIELFYDAVRRGTFQPLPDLFSRRGYISRQFGNSGFTVQLLSTGVDYGFDGSYEFSYNPYDSYGLSHRFFEFLRENRNREFFVYLHYNTPHKPFYAPPRYFLKGVLRSPVESLWRPDFMGCISYTDDVFRNLYDSFKTRGLLDNSIIVIATDHGSGFDLSKYDAGFQYADYTRMTFMLHLPPELKKRMGPVQRRVKTYISQINIAPTLADLAGLGSVEAFAGKSFAPLLKDGSDLKMFDREIWTFGRKTFSIINRDLMKYILTLPDDRRFVNREYTVMGTEREVPYEHIYDLAKDPHEKENLTGKRRDLLWEFRKRVLERDIHHPERNILSFFPGEKAEKTRITIRVDSPSSLIQAGIFGANFGLREGLTVRRVGTTGFLEFVIDKEPLNCFFELADDRAPLSIHISAGGKGLKKSDIFATPLYVNLFDNPVRLKSLDEFLLLSVTRIPDPPRAEAGKSPGLKVVLSRMDLHRWIDAGQFEQSSISAGMKQTLKSWGYIQ